MSSAASVDRGSSRLSGLQDGRTSAAQSVAWSSLAPSAITYDPVASTAAVVEAARSQRSSEVHKRTRKKYLEYCAKVGVDPFKVNATSAVHVATFCKDRTKNLELGTSTSNHVSAQMALFFTELGCTGRWTTGEIDGKAFVNGNPNDRKAVEDMKRAHKVELARDGRVTLPMDPLEYGHICAYYDHFIVDQDHVSPRILSQFSAMMTATSLLMRFEEVNKIKYVDERSRRLRDQSISAPVRAETSSFVLGLSRSDLHGH